MEKHSICFASLNFCAHYYYIYNQMHLFMLLPFILSGSQGSLSLCPASIVWEEVHHLGQVYESTTGLKREKQQFRPSVIIKTDNF